MSDHAVYLFKAARRPRYRKENLRLLAEERGTVIEVAYNKSWVAPEYFEDGAIARGTPAYFVFTERPYELFVPVREGEVVEARQEERMLRLQVLLKNWVGVEDRDLDDFTQLVKQTDPQRAPGEKFVAPKRDGLDLVAYYDEREDAGWRRTVDQVLEMSAASQDDPYRESVFFRPAGLRVGDELLAARQLPLETGADASVLLHFHNPHLSDDDVARHALRVLAPEDALEAEAPERFPAIGELEFPIAVVGEGPELKIQIAPAPARHTFVTERLLTRGHESRVEVRAPSDDEERRAKLLRLYDFIRRTAVFTDPADRLDCFDRFQALLPGEQRIAEDRALCLHSRYDDAEGAYRELCGLNPETLGDDARFLLFRLRLERDGDASPAHHVEALDLAAEGRFDRFLAELDGLEATMLARLLPQVVLELPADRLRTVMNRAGSRLEEPAALVALADALYINTEDPGWAYEYLNGRRAALRIDSALISDKLLELAHADGRTSGDADLAADTARRVHNLIQQDRLGDAFDLLGKAGRSVSAARRERIYNRAADALLERDRPEMAARVLADLADASLRSADGLESASKAIERAYGIAAGRGIDSFPEWLTETATKVNRAWQASEDLVDWRKSERERRAERLHAALGGETILIAGGLEQPDWIPRLRDRTGADFDWCERYRGEGDDLDARAERIRNGQYALVVHLWQKTGHAVQERLKPACAAAGVPFVAARSVGVRGIVEGLWAVVGEDDG